MKKLKQQYRDREVREQRGYVWDVYPNLRSGIHRKFSTRQEKSFYCLHKIEYREYPLKLRPSRGMALPDSWDDLPSYVYDLAKSWKHNSKRRHQYYK